MELKGKKVLITGAAIRIGATLCRVFANAGAHVTIHCLTSIREAEELCNELGGAENGHSVYVCDLRDSIVARKMVRTVKPDILVNNASTYIRRSFATETFSEAEEQFKINFFTPVEMIREFALCERVTQGVVINFLDQAIARKDSDAFSYLLSKKMLAEATGVAALEYAPDIRVNGIAPGPVMAPKELEHLGMKKTLESLPLHRPVDLNDLSAAVLFLVSNSSVTGEILFVDCGQHLL